jgi:hypothetical protein
MYLKFIETIFYSYIFRKRTIFILAVALIAPIYVGVQSTFAVSTHNGDTLRVTLDSTINVTGNTLNLTTLDESISIPATGWSDTDTVSLNISITNSSDDTATVITTAGCVVDISSSATSGVYGTKQDQSVDYIGVGPRSFSVFVIEDSTTSTTLTGEIRNVAEAISFVQVRCPTSNDLFNKRIRVGIVPSLPADATNGKEALYYLFSTNRYYRNELIPNGATAGGLTLPSSITNTRNSDTTKFKWEWAKTQSISVNGTSKNVTGSSQRKGWAATLTTRDEIVLSNAMGVDKLPMIGVSDLLNEARRTFTYDSTAWGGSGDTVTLNTNGVFRWLGPDSWGQLLPTYDSTVSPNPNQNQYWIRVNGLWETTTSTTIGRIDLQSCSSNTIESTDNGYGLAHAWHIDSGCGGNSSQFRPTEPNGTGPYVYEGYQGSGSIAGWDDAPDNTSFRNDDERRSIKVEYCSPANPCTPPDAAVASISITVDCTSTGRLVNGDFESLPSGITEASVTNNNRNNGTWHGYNGLSYSEPRQILFLTDQTDTSTSNFKLPGWSTNNNANSHRVEIQRYIDGYGPQSSQSGGNNFDNTGPDAAGGINFAEINAENLGTLYQDVRTIPGTTLRWRMYHRGRAVSGVDEMKVRIGPASAALSNYFTVATTTYDNTPSRRPSNSGSGASMQDARGSTSLMGGPKSSTDSQTVGGSSGGWGYYEGRYTVGSSETSTRFAFVSVSVASGNTSVGNLIDEINFSPLIACPATFSVVAGRTTLINPFDLNLNGNTNGIDSTDSLGWDNAFVSETLSVTSGTVARTSHNGVTNRAINYTAPATTGTYQMDFTIANSFGDLSTSRFIINVIPDTGARAPGGLPVDPRTTTYKLGLPQVTSATGRVLACLQELNSSGDTITGTIRFDLGTYGTAQDTLTVLSDTVTLTVSGTSTDRTNYLRASGPIASVNKALEGLRLTRTSNAKFKGTYYLRFSSVVTGLSTAPEPTNCDGAISSARRDITLRPMTLYEVRRKVVPLVNGKS